MTKRRISKDKLVNLIKSEAAKDPVCEDLTDVQIFGTEEGAGTNWMPAWRGLGIDRAANSAMADIIKNLTAEYDVQWESVH